MSARALRAAGLSVLAGAAVVAAAVSMPLAANAAGLPTAPAWFTSVSGQIGALTGGGAISTSDRAPELRFTSTVDAPYTVQLDDRVVCTGTIDAGGTGVCRTPPITGAGAFVTVTITPEGRAPFVFADAVIVREAPAPSAAAAVLVDGSVVVTGRGTAGAPVDAISASGGSGRTVVDADGAFRVSLGSGSVGDLVVVQVLGSLPEVLTVVAD